MTMDPTQPAAPVPSPSPVSSPTPAREPIAQVAPVGPVVAVRPRSRSAGLINALLLVAAALAVGGVAFAVGRSTAPAAAFQALPGGNIVRPDGSFTPGAGGPAGGLGGGLSIDGTVTAVDADSLTLTLANGNEMTFTLDAGTTYREATDATPADVAVGDDVSVGVDGGGRGPQGGGGTTTPELTASDVTVSR